MTFESLDSKIECFGVYKDGKLYTKEDEIPALDRTWKFSPGMGSSVDYAYLYCQGKSIDDVCPAKLKEGWVKINEKLKAFYTSFLEAKVSLDDNCFYDLVPEKFLLEYCRIKCAIVDSIFERYPKPKNYSFLKDVYVAVQNISERKLNLASNTEASLISSHIPVEKRRLFHKIRKKEPYVSYNIFGTRTGRLTTNKGYLPILSLDKSFRALLRPVNDKFIEIDYNAAELRTFIALCGNLQPANDIHLEHSAALGVGREEAKVMFLSWLYGSGKYDVGPLSDMYDKESVLDLYYDGNVVETLYGRVIQCEKRNALNYLLQSTTSDIVLSKVVEIENLLKRRKSFVSFCMHDSIVLDVSREDVEVMKDVVGIFSQTQFGLFPINAKIGGDYGNLMEVKI